MSNKKKIIVLFGILISVAVIIAIILKLTNKTTIQFMFAECEYSPNDIEVMTGININSKNEYKLEINSNVKSGGIDVELYYIPEDHIIYKVSKYGYAEMISRGELDEKNVSKIMSDITGLDMVYKESITESGTVIIDASGFEDGLYSLRVVATEDASVTGTMWHNYVRYGWMDLVEIIYEDMYWPQ